MTGEAEDGGPEGVGDAREKHVTVFTRSDERHEHGDVYLRHADDAFLVSPTLEFPLAETTRYPKADLLRVEVTQHHSACFVTTAAAGEGPTLDALRGFRDDAMVRTPAGRALVGLYYAASPPVADTVERHPDSRTARAVRWLVERCGALARRREDAGPAGRLALSLVLTALYAVGLGIAAGGHGCIRLRERLRG
ncbi:MAG: CFI-box-CTERM domain-containing protein [Haloarculaceae archaeon]